MSKTVGIKFTIPDGTPEFQLGIVRDIKNILVTISGAVGEVFDPTEIDEIISGLEPAHPTTKPTIKEEI